MSKSKNLAAKVSADASASEAAKPTATLKTLPGKPARKPEAAPAAPKPEAAPQAGWGEIEGGPEGTSLEAAKPAASAASAMWDMASAPRPSGRKPAASKPESVNHYSATPTGTPRPGVKYAFKIGDTVVNRVGFTRKSDGALVAGGLSGQIVGFGVHVRKPDDAAYFVKFDGLAPPPILVTEKGLRAPKAAPEAAKPAE